MKKIKCNPTPPHLRALCLLLSGAVLLFCGVAQADPSYWPFFMRTKHEVFCFPPENIYQVDTRDRHYYAPPSLQTVTYAPRNHQRTYSEPKHTVNFYYNGVPAIMRPR